MAVLSRKPVLLDGGMGRELRFRGVDILNTIWSANGLLTAPEIVQHIHADYIAAGADIITTNIRHHQERSGQGRDRASICGAQPACR